jgi:hypothetical protein
VQHDYVLSFTNLGTAVDNFDLPITFCLYKGNTKVSDFVNGIAQYTMTEREADEVTELTFHITAENTIISNGAYITYSNKVVHRTIGYYDGESDTEIDEYGREKSIPVYTECVMYYRLPRNIPASEQETIVDGDDEYERERKSIKNAGFVEVEPYIFTGEGWILCSLR